MKCVACSALIPDGAAFCPQCGQRMGPGAEIASSTVATPADKLRQASAAIGSSDDPERQLWRGGYSPRAMVGYWIVAGLLTIGGIVLGVMLQQPEVWYGVAIAAGALWVSLLVYYFYLRLSIDYQLTSQRLLHRKGILSQTTGRIEVIDVDDVSITQGLVERMLNVGTIRLLSSDTSDPTLVMRGIADAQNVGHMIDSVRREERRRRGLHIETV